MNHDYLRRIISYDPKTGIFSWLVFRGSRAPKGGVAGSVRPDGYRVINIDGKHYQANRLAWFWMTGEWPEGLVDHANKSPDDNRWINLRDTDHSGNHANSKHYANNTSGYKGVWFDKRSGRWCAQINFGNRRHNLGMFASITEAAAVRSLAEGQIFGEFAP